MVEPLLQPASSDQAEAADEASEVLEDQAAPVPVLAAELNAPANAPAATKTKAWSLSDVSLLKENANAFHCLLTHAVLRTLPSCQLCFQSTLTRMAKGIGNCAAEQ